MGALYTFYLQTYVHVYRKILGIKGIQLVEKTKIKLHEHLNSGIASVFCFTCDICREIFVKSE